MNNLLLVLLTIPGFRSNKPKVDLHRKPTFEDRVDEVRDWVNLNFSFIALAVVIGVLVFFVWFCFFMVGLSATESGMLYNNFDKVI